jgi:hypothetical protein
MSRTHKLSAAALATILCFFTPAAVTSQPKDEAVRTSPGWEGQAVAEGGYLAWQHMSRRRAGHSDVYLRKPSGTVVKVNRAGTEGGLGAIDGDTLVYQEYRGDNMAYGPTKFSRIVLYDLKTGKRTVPPRVNGYDSEFLPTIWGPWIFYGRAGGGGRHLVGFNRSTGQTVMPDTYVGYVQPGDPAEGLFPWVHWNPGQGRSEVRVYDVENEREYYLASRRWQWAPSVGPQGAVYVLETGRTCGTSPVVKRFARTLSGELVRNGKEIMRLPRGVDYGWSGAYADASGHATVVHQRYRCGTDWGSDIYRFSDTVSLDVSKEGSGEGAVTGDGIDCGEDCAEVYSGGSWVTLSAEPELGSHFVGWSHECEASDPEEDSCTFRIDDTMSVTATFDLGPL